MKIEAMAERPIGADFLSECKAALLQSSTLPDTPGKLLVWSMNVVNGNVSPPSGVSPEVHRTLAAIRRHAAAMLAPTGSVLDQSIALEALASQLAGFVADTDCDPQLRDVAARAMQAHSEILTALGTLRERRECRDVGDFLRGFSQDVQEEGLLTCHLPAEQWVCAPAAGEHELGTMLNAHLLASLAEATHRHLMRGGNMSPYVVERQLYAEAAAVHLQLETLYRSVVRPFQSAAEGCLLSAIADLWCMAAWTEGCMPAHALPPLSRWRRMAGMLIQDLQQSGSIGPGRLSAFSVLPPRIPFGAH